MKRTAAARSLVHSTPVSTQRGSSLRVSRGIYIRARLSAGVLVLALVLVLVASIARPAATNAATSDTVNFQAKLMTNTGAVAPDGYYNVEFKLYSASTGGTALWTEDWYDSNGVTAGNDNRVRVANGYLTVNLGGQNPFPSNLNWAQNMYITMNVGGTTQTATPSWDGEMNPRLKLTAVPYAFSAGNLSNYNSTTGFTSTLSFQGATGRDQAIQIPDNPSNATDQVCLLTLGNCFGGAGGGIAGAGTQNFIAKFDNSSGYHIGSSSIYDDGNFVGINNSLSNDGLLSVHGLNASQSSIFVQGTGSATAATAVIKQGASQTGNLIELQDSNGNVNASFNNTGNILALGRVSATGTVTQGQLKLADGTNDNFTLTVKGATLTANSTVTIPNAGGNDTVCLLTLANCTGTGGGIAGSGTQNYIAKFDTVGGSHIGADTTGAFLYDNGSFLGVGTNVNSGFVSVQGSGAAQSSLFVQGAASASAPTIAIKQATSQGGDLLQLVDTSGNALGGFAANGSLYYTNSGFTTTLSTQTLTANQLISLPNESGVLCIQGSSACGFESTGGNDFIQNQTASNQSAGFKINGNGTLAILTANTSVLTSLIDAPTAGGSIALGTTNATGGISLNQNTTIAAGKSINFATGAGNFDMHLSTGTFQTGTGNVTINGDTTLAAGKSFQIVGGTTGTRPLTPSEGTLYYDQSTHSLLVYNGTKWQADRSSHTKIVAPAGASQDIKDSADYVGNGTTDQTVINAALTAAAGGTVLLLPGTYTTTGTILIPNHTTLAGSGSNTTTIKLNAGSSNVNFIENSDTSTGTGVSVEDLTLDNSLSTGGTQNAVYLNGADYNVYPATSRLSDLILTGSSTVPAILLHNSSLATFKDNTTGDITLDNTYVSTFANNSTVNISVINGGYINTFTGNYTGSVSLDNHGYIAVVSGNYSGAFSVTSSSDIEAFTGNTLYGNFSINGSNIQSISGNELTGAISLTNTDARGITTLSGNTIFVNSTGEGITLTNADKVQITGNHFINNGSATVGISIDSTTNGAYLNDNALNGLTIQDNGTNTTYGGQIDGSNNFVIQPAGGSILLNGGTTVTGALTQSGGAVSLQGNAASSITTTVGNLTLDAAANLNLGNTSATGVTIGHAGITTEIQGDTKVTLSGTTGTTLVCQNGSGVLSGCTNSYETTGGNDFIQNQTASTQTAGFKIDGTGTVGTIQIATTGSIDTSAAGALNIGLASGGNATSINLNQNVNLANGVNLTFGTSGNFDQSASSGTFKTGTGNVSINGAATASAGITLTNGGALATQKGTDFATVGTSNNVSFGAASLYRLTGASAQTITGIAGGVDGRILTLVNAGSTAAVIKNNDSTDSSAGNLIITGTGNDYSLSAGASVTLIYDSGANVWRVVSAAGGITSVGAISGTSNANGATITGSTLNLTAADGTNGGVLTNIAQTIAGLKTFQAGITSASINTTAGQATSLGNSTGSLTITGNSSSTFVINGSTIDATEFTRLDGKDAPLVDTNDAVATAITGTGTLTTGSINWSGNVTTSGNISTTGSGTITSAGLLTANGGLTVSGATNLTGSLTQTGGAVSLTGNAASQISTTTGSFTLDAATNVNIGTTNATNVNIGRTGQTITLNGTTTSNGNIIVAAGNSLTIVGGNTASRPASPTEGTVYYDSTTHQLLQYNGTKWVSARSTATKIVAASDSSQAMKDAADYVATGTNDETTINAALTAAAGGTVYLAEGTYTLSGSVSIPNNTMLSGAGRGTLLTIPNALNTNFVAITNTDTSTGTGIVIRDLRLDGNKANQSGSTSMSGVALVGVGGTGRSGATITNVRSNNWYYSGTTATPCYYGAGFCLSNTQYSTITESMAQGDQNGILLITSTTNFNVINNNLLQSDGGGISLSSATDNTITGNNIQNSTSYGVFMVTAASRNTVVGNVIESNGLVGIYVFGSSNNNVISSNKLLNNGGNTTNNAIYLSGADSNTITGNNINDSSATSNNYAINVFDSTSDTNYLADNNLGGGSINDAGTGTIYGGQLDGSNVYTVQGASGIKLGNNTTVNGSLTQSGGAVSLQGNAASSITTTTGNLTLDAAAALQLGTTNATSIAIGHAGITTTIAGSTSVTLQGSTSTTLVCSNSGVLSTCDSSVLAPTSGNFIQNQTASTQTGGFKISGNGSLGGNLTVTGTTTATGLITANGGITSATINTTAGQATSLGNSTGAVTFTGNNGTTFVINGITVDATEFNRLDGKDAALVDTNDAVATAIIGTGTLTTGSINWSGNIQTSGNISTTGTGTITSAGIITANGGLAVANTGSLATQKNADYSTVGSQNDVNLGAGSLVRLTGASAQTITGIAGGVDGRILTIVNAGTTTATLVDQSSGAASGSAAANRITTGTGGDIALPAGSSITLIYDSGASLWRVTGSTAISGGATAGVTTVGSISTTASANGATITGTTLNLTAADGSNGGVLTAAGQTIGGLKTFQNGITSTNINTTAGQATTLGNTTGTLTITGNASSTFVINGATVDATEFNRLDGKDAALVDTNDAVNTAITGTGTLTTGAINWSGNVTTSGNISTTGTGTITAAGLITANGGLTSANINTTAGQGTTLGNSTGTLTITGNSSSTWVINGSTIDATEFTRLDGKDAAIVDTNDAVATAITGTGTLTTGAINWSGAVTTSGNISTTGTGTITSAGMLTANGGLTATNINGTAAQATNLGNTTGNLTVTGNSSSTFNINGITVDATEFNRLDGKDAALVDTNDAVATAITGTGTLTTGSINWSGNIATSGNISTSGTGTITSAGIITANGGVTVANTGSLSTAAGASFTTPGASPNAALNTASFYTMNTSGAAQVIQGITAGRDGQRLTLTNINASAVTLANNNGSATGAKIITGTGNDISIVNGASVELIYDNAASVWRIVGGVGGTSVTTVGAISSTPDANGATITGNTLNLTAADATNGGVLTAGTQTIGGAKTFQGGITSTNINTTAGQSTSLGNSTGTLTVTGNSSTTFVINGATVDATEFNRLDGKDAALVDTNDAVSTAITGTGTLTTGSINWSGNITTSGNISTTGTGTITAAGLITANGGLTAANINTTAGQATSLGNSTGSLTITGNSSSTFVINGSTIDATEFTRLDGKDAPLVDTNDAVATAITGTGTLTTGSINWSGAITTSGNISTTGTGTITSAGMLTANGGLTATNINTTAAQATNLGNTTGNLTVTGNSSSTFNINGATVDATEFNRLDGKDAALVDTNDAVATAITGTGTLTTGSINWSGNIATSGNISTSGTGTITSAGIITANGGVNVANTGSLSTAAGASFTTPGISPNAALNTASFYTLNTSGAAQVIQGITAGRDGQRLTLTNINASAVTLADNSGSATGAKIITGAGADMSLINGASVELIYDNAAGVWRVVGGVGGTSVTNVGAISGTANANGATITGNTLNLTAADGSHGGVLTYLGQTIGGLKTFQDGITSTNINTTAGQATNLGNSTGNLTVTGNASSTFNINGVTVDATEFNRLDGKDAALVDVNDAVSTAITGTGTLTSGSINWSGNIQTSGNITTTGTGTITAAGLITANGGLTAANINTTAGQATSLGNTTGAITFTGNSGTTFVINGVTVDATEFNRLDGKDAPLVDTNDAVSTAITGTGTLTTGAINWAGNIQTSGNITTTGSGTITAAGLLTANGGLTAANINTTAGQATSLGNTTGAVTITGNSSSTFVINGVTVDATEFGRLDGKDAPLVDTNDAVNTAITGTGALTTGSINWSGNIATSGNISTSGSGTITAAGLITANGGLTSTNINTTAGQATNLGNTTGNLTVTGNSSSTFVINGATIDATEFGRLDGKDAPLVDTNDAVATAITGTGALTTGSINWAGNIQTSGNISTTGSGTITSAGMLTANGGLTATNINGTAGQATNLGNTTGTLTITGNSSSTFVINGSTIDATEFTRLDGKDAPLVDTNDAVATAITGTGALTTGSINWSGAITTSGNISTTGSGTITAAGLLTANGGLTAANINTTAGQGTTLGNTTGTLSVTGNSSSTFNINGVTVDATEFNRLDGKDAPLVDTNDAVATAITGTGALTTGSINWSGNITTSGNISTTGTGTITSAGVITANGGVTVANTGSLVTQKGADFSLTAAGTGDNVNFGAGSLFRLTGASTQTITGILNGVDGRMITLINAAAQPATIANESASSTAANRILTGTGSDISLPIDASITMVYDSGASRWRVTSSVAASGGVGVNTVGTYAATNHYANGASISGTTITLGSADATHPGLIDTSAQTFAGAKTFSALLTGNAGLSITGTTTLTGALTQSGGAVSLTGNASSSLTTTTGTLNVDGPTLTFGTSAATSISLGNTSSSLTIESNGTANLFNGATAHTINLATGAAAQTVNIGSTNTTSSLALNAGNGGLTLQTQGGNATADIGIGNNAVAQKIVIGNTTGATSLALQGGSGGVNITGALTANNNVTIGATAGSGTVFTNNGATVNTTLNITSATGVFGTAAATVDIYTSFAVSSTAANQVFTVPTPFASTTYGRTIFVSNIGTNSFTFANTYLTAILKPGATASLIWENVNGVANWTYAGADGNGILNQTAQQTSANFNIDGTGKAANFDGTGTTLGVGTATTGNLTLGNGTAGGTNATTVQAATGGVTIQTATSSGSGNTGNITLQTGAASSGSNNTSGSVIITSGNATGGNASSGSVSIDVGSKTGTGTAGSINIGTGANAPAAIVISKTGGATTNINGNITFGASAGSGTIFTNNGASVVTAATTVSSAVNLTLTASTTVDTFTNIPLSATAANVVFTIPAPTAPNNTVYGRLLYITNVGTNTFSFANTYLTATLKQGATASLIWANVNGSGAWTYAGSDAGGIFNQTTQQTGANFNIDGTGKAAGFDATSGALAIGGSVATSITVGNTANTASWSVQGTAGATYTIGTSTNTGGITLGNSIVGNTIAIGAGITTTGTQTVNIATATGNGGTAAINIGTSATAGSTSNITIGSTIAGTTTLQSAGGTTINSNTQISAGKTFAVNGAQTSLTGASAGSGTAVIINTGATTNNGLYIQGVASQGSGTNLLRIQDSSAANIFQVRGDDTIELGGSAHTSSILFSSTSLTSGGILKTMTAGTGGISTNDAVVFASDSGNARVLETTTSNDSRVFGVATSTATAGNSVSIATYGFATVKYTGTAPVVGDILVTSTVAGSVKVDNFATKGILGYATTNGAAGTVGVAINPVGGAGGSDGNALVQVPASNTAGSSGANVISPTVNSITALTVNGTTGTAATAAIINQTGNAIGLQINGSSSDTSSNLLELNTTTATSGNLLSISQTTASFTGTAAKINLANPGAGAKLIDLQNNGSSKFNVDANGVVTLAGGQTADITTSGATTLKLDTGAAAAITIGGVNANQINLGHANITTAITGVASITNTSATTSLNVTTNTTPTTAVINVNDTSATSTDKLLSLKLSGNEVFGVDAAGNVKVLPSASIDTNAAGTLNFGTANASTINIGKTAAAGAQTINIGTNTTAGSTLVIGSTTSGTTTLQSAGGVLINTAVFTTASGGASADANCFTGGAVVHTSCTITSTTVAAYSAVVVGFDQSGQIASLPDPAGGTPAGRVIYVTAANGSSDFTLRVNGGGTGNDIAMRQNTTATMIWNGADWTAAGASSSTTLQAAYDNTLTSAGGAELLLSSTSNHNGLTIRDSATSSVGGTLLEVQNSSAATVLSVNANVTDYANNGGAETAFGTEWALIPSSGATVTRNTSQAGYIATGIGSVSIATSTSANSGAKNVLNTTLTPNQHYNVSFAAKLTSGSAAFTDLNVYYSVDGTTASAACTNYSTQTVNTSVWSKVSCTFTAPASGIVAGNSIFIRQTSAPAAGRTFYVDNLSVTIAADLNYATDGGVDDNTNFATNWPALNSATITRDTTTGYDASDSAKVVTTTSANMGVKNVLSVNPLPSTLYRISAYVKLNSGTLNDFTIAYSPDDGGTAGVNLKTCTDYNTQALSTTGFTQITCYVTTGSVGVSAPRVYFYEPSSGTAQTFWVDTFSMTLASNNTPNVQIGGGVNGGPTTLLTLDRAASAPIAANNDALLGSMYYDTTQGKIQCYQASGWGSCGAASDSIVTISPEYTNAVFHAATGTTPGAGTPGVGVLTSDLCSDYLDINDATHGDPICSTNETYNFYKWTSPQASNQTYAIYVTYQLPSTFKSFTSGSTYILGRTDAGSSGGAAVMSYKVFKSNAGGMSQCGGSSASVNVASGTSSSWSPTAATATGVNDPSTCGFSAGDKVVFEIDMQAYKDAKVYVSNLGFTYSNK